LKSANDAVDGEPETGCEARDIGDLQLAARGTKDGAQSGIRIDNAGDLSEAAQPVAEVVDRVSAADRVLGPNVVVKNFAGHSAIDLIDRTAETTLG
jgi:hypothetical protein